MSVVRRRLLISGRVQGVGFRWYCYQLAGAAGLAGSARNLRDGRVELILEGPADVVAAVERECRLGPTPARVDRVEESDESPTGLRGFDTA